MPMQTRIEAALRKNLAPERLEVIDESELHRGHAGWREGGETHYRVRIASPELAGMSRLARHRAVHAALGPQILEQIHALALEVED